MSVENIVKNHLKEYEKVLREIKINGEKKSEIILENWISENKDDGIYKVKVWRNDAETSRDIDYISVLEEKYFNDINIVIEYSKRYVKEHFINPDSFRIIEGNLVCSDICSFGKTIELTRIEVIK